MQPNSPLLKNSLSIAEAKQYFDANLWKDTKPERLMSSSSSNSNLSLKDILNKKQAIWESAYEQLISTGGIVKVPLDFGKVYAVVNKKTNALVTFSSLNYLLMYKDSLQIIHAEWVFLNPDSTWLYGNRNQYTGTIFVKNWEGKTLRTIHYPLLNQDISGMVKNSKFSSLGSVKKVSIEENAGEHVTPYCVTLSSNVPKNCNCPAWRLAQFGCDNCDICAGIKWTKFCDWPDPDCTLCDDNPNNPSGGGGGNTGGGGGSGGGGVPPGSYIPSCNSDPNYIMPSTPPPGGGQWILPCSGPGSVPIPATPSISPLLLQSIINFMGITDTDRQNFLLAHNDIYTALADYLLKNGNSPENKEFVNWAAGYLNSHPTITVGQFENFLECIQEPDYRPRDNEPSSYPWKKKLHDNNDDWSKVYQLTQPLFLNNGAYNPEAFNCHYYAFAGYAKRTLASEGAPKWVLDISLVGWEKVTDKIKIGDRVMYFTANSGATRDEWLHSGIVVEVDSDGYATKISSKMGEYDVIEHHPRDIPEQYGSSAPTFTINGKEYPSRIYWRKK